jgi:sec-independent protein translocase protein TatA
MPGWIGPWEIAIVLVLVILIFGPRKLPELGSSLGKSIRGFKKGLSESQEEIKAAVSEVRDVAKDVDIQGAVSEVREVTKDLNLKGTLNANVLKDAIKLDAKPETKTETKPDADSDAAPEAAAETKEEQSPQAE